MCTKVISCKRRRRGRGKTHLGQERGDNHATAVVHVYGGRLHECSERWRVREKNLQDAQPCSLSERMAASTMGNPVRPSFQAFSFAPSLSMAHATVPSYLRLNGLPMLTRGHATRTCGKRPGARRRSQRTPSKRERTQGRERGTHSLVKVAPRNLLNPHSDARVAPAGELLAARELEREADALARRDEACGEVRTVGTSVAQACGARSADWEGEAERTRERGRAHLMWLVPSQSTRLRPSQYSPILLFFFGSATSPSASLSSGASKNLAGRILVRKKRCMMLSVTPSPTGHNLRIRDASSSPPSSSNPGIDSGIWCENSEPRTGCERVDEGLAMTGPFCLCM